MRGRSPRIIFFPVANLAHSEPLTREPLPVGFEGYVGISEMVLLMPPGMRSYSTVTRAIKARQIPARKMRGRWAMDPVAVIAKLKEGEEIQSRVVEIIQAIDEERHRLRPGWVRSQHHRPSKCPEVLAGF